MSTDIRDVRQRVTAQLHQPEPSKLEASMLERLSDPTFQNPSVTQQATRGSSGRGGVQWVRASDVLQGHGTRLADVQTSGQASLVRQMRHGMSQIATSRRGSVQQAVSLPPVGSFGQTPVVSQGQAVGA